MRALGALTALALLFGGAAALADAPNQMGTPGSSTSSAAAAEKTVPAILFLRIKGDKSLSRWSTLVWGTAGTNVFTLTLGRPAPNTADTFLPASKSTVPTVELAMAKDNKGTLVVYEMYTLSNVIVTSHATAGGTDSLVLRFAKMVSKSIAPSDNENQPGSTVGWDLKQNTKQ